MTTPDNGCQCGTAAVAVPVPAIEPCACGCGSTTPAQRPTEKDAADVERPRGSVESEPAQR